MCRAFCAHWKVTAAQCCGKKIRAVPAHSKKTAISEKMAVFLPILALRDNFPGVWGGISTDFLLSSQ